MTAGGVKANHIGIATGPKVEALHLLEVVVWSVDIMFTFLILTENIDYMTVNHAAILETMVTVITMLENYVCQLNLQ